jgi:hypothetical protein
VPAAVRTLNDAVAVFLKQKQLVEDIQTQQSLESASDDASRAAIAEAQAALIAAKDALEKAWSVAGLKDGAVQNLATTLQNEYMAAFSGVIDAQAEIAVLESVRTNAEKAVTQAKALVTSLLIDANFGANEIAGIKQLAQAAQSAQDALNGNSEQAMLLVKQANSALAAALQLGGIEPGRATDFLRLVKDVTAGTGLISEGKSKLLQLVLSKLDISKGIRIPRTTATLSADSAVGKVTGGRDLNMTVEAALNLETKEFSVNASLDAISTSGVASALGNPATGVSLQMDSVGFEFSRTRLQASSCTINVDCPLLQGFVTSCCREGFCVCSDSTSCSSAGNGTASAPSQNVAKPAECKTQMEACTETGNYRYKAFDSCCSADYSVL